MEYDHDQPHEDDAAPLKPAASNSSSKTLKLVIIIAFTLVAVSVGLAVRLRNKHTSAHHRRPTEAMSRACSRTRYQNLCLNSLLDFPGSLSAKSDEDMVQITVNMTLQRVGRALYTSAEISNLEMDTHVRSAYEDCLELLEDSVDQLTRSLESSSSSEDVMTWLSAALTNQDTCKDGLSEVENGGYVKQQMEEGLKELSELVSNCLAIYAADLKGVPVGRMSLIPSRKELESPVVQADIVVSTDGKGTCKTIAEAIKRVPEYSTRRIIIYVKAGRLQEFEKT